jgi:signal transduction histidine kinase/CheY-like chemotaxis protein
VLYAITYAVTFAITTATAPCVEHMSARIATAKATQTRQLIAADVLDAIDQGFALFDENDRLLVANAAYREIFAGIADIIQPGVPFETLVCVAAQRHQNLEAIQDPQGWIQGRLAKHRAAAGVYEHKFSDGRWIQVRERRTALGHFLCTYTDVTSLILRTEELATARDALSAVSRRMKAMIEASSDWVWSSNAYGLVNCELQVAGSQHGFDPSRHIEAALQTAMHVSTGDVQTLEVATAARFTVPVPVHLPDGSTRFLKISGKAIRDDQGLMEGFVGTATDETEKINSQRDAEHRAAVLQAVLHSIATGVVVFSSDGFVVMCNPRAQVMLGLPIKCGDTLAKFQDSLGAAWVDKLVLWSAQRQATDIACDEVETPTGTVLTSRANFMATGGFVIAFADVTEQRRAIMTSHQSQKLIALGELAGGVAHEFNNLLTAISGFAHMARQSVHKPETAVDCLNEVIGATEHAAALTRQMLTFSRRDRFEEKTVVGADIVRSLVKLIQPLLPETVSLRVLFDDATSRIKVDVAQVSQAVMNLILNARDSMPQGGAIELRVGLGTPADEAKAGRWLVFTVADEGSGIDEANLPRIFDPFFTTKAQGQGTGLGLSVTHGVVRRSGGTIKVESRLGVGTTFSLHLPVAEDDRTPNAPTPASKAVASHGDGRRVMLVEDEPAVRRFVQQTLRAQGYQVQVAGSWAEVVPWLAASAPQFDLLLSDMVLPGKCGPEIAAEVRGRFPTVHVLFMSGYVTPDIQQLGLLDQATPMLNKPFTPEALCQAVAQALDTSTAPVTVEPA